MKYTEECTYCSGTGRVRHVCRMYTFRLLKRTGSRGWQNSYYRCKVCGKYHKSIYHGYDYDSDIHWLVVGETQDYMSFTQEELDNIIKSLDK